MTMEQTRKAVRLESEYSLGRTLTDILFWCELLGIVLFVVWWERRVGDGPIIIGVLASGIGSAGAAVVVREVVHAIFDAADMALRRRREVNEEV